MYSAYLRPVPYHRHKVWFFLFSCRRGRPPCNRLRRGSTALQNEQVEDFFVAVELYQRCCCRCESCHVVVVKPVDGISGGIEGILLAKRTEPVTNLFYQVGRYVETVVIDDRLNLGFDIVDVETIYFIRIVASPDKIHIIGFVRPLSRRLGEAPCKSCRA